MAEKNMIKIYVDASSAKRVDIIIKHYTDFMGIVDGYTEGLRYMIECEKESNSHRELGDLGVRVQTGGTTSDPTAKKAIRNVMTREAIINCDFSGDVMDGVDRAEEFMRDAYLLRDMRKDYDLFNRQLSILGTEKETFEKYLRREKTLIDIAEEQGITTSEDPQNQTESKKTGSRLHGWKDGRYCVMEEKRCYTVKELQEILGISRPTVYELLKRNEFRWIQIGTKYRISKKSFDEWLDRKMENP